MNELDLLKMHWQKDQGFIKFKQEDIINMIHKNSSSIVKCLLIICCTELAVGLILSVYPFFKFDIPSISTKFIVNWIISFLFYAVILYFIYNFFKLYKNIKNSNNTKALLESIVAVRKNTDNYIKFNLLYLTIVFIISYIFYLIEESSTDKMWGKAIFMGIGLALFVLLFRKLMKLYYKLLYGFLLKKLMKNYEELICLEENEEESEKRS